jgi:hypothetical protein
MQRLNRVSETLKMHLHGRPQVQKTRLKGTVDPRMATQLLGSVRDSCFQG